ncbi:hypothetical protein CEY16_12125 [Halalkalibacillus sediminis]|uniref:YdbS-like PH domain-containing protein n=1 Tax=Halalkalibacillus sediminis TaxID=2018042 RepID=A0A2I0QT19_9BACI|nr:PH domain-containing protein [Halalkalibacillus sediminis]PKR77466.1 hypothetical protein CEY16_12125 [Halalkalibacillus sediminis]
MFDLKRLHPVAVIFQMFKIVRQIYLAIIPIVVLTIQDGFLLYLNLGVLLLLMLLIGSSVLHWLRFKYTVENDELYIEKGILIRKKRYISKNRIQSIDLTQGIIHRIFGLTKVDIETAGSNEGTDASLSAVTFAEGHRLQNALKNRQQTDSFTEVDEKLEKEEAPSIAISQKRLLIAGSTSGSIGVILALFAFGLSEVERFIPESFYNQVAQWFLGLTIEFIIGLALFLLIILWVLGILGTMIRYGNFKITKYENEIFITRGLIEKRQMTIPLKRIQAVGIEESLIRQPLGYATIFVEIAGGVKEMGGEGHTVLFPIMKKKEIPGFLETILPEYQQMPDGMTGLPKRALPYYMARGLWVPLVLSVVVSVFWLEWIFIPLALLVISSFFAWLRYLSVGYSVDGKDLSISHRVFAKTTVLLKKQRMQSFKLKQHFLHKKQGLANMNTSVLNNFSGRHYELKEMEQSDVDLLFEWYSVEPKEHPKIK